MSGRTKAKALTTKERGLKSLALQAREKSCKVDCSFGHFARSYDSAER